MGKAYKCDHCGKLFEKQGNHCYFYEILGDVSVSLTFSLPRGSGQNSRPEADLCDSCLADVLTKVIEVIELPIKEVNNNNLTKEN